MTQASPARLDKRLAKKKPNQSRSFDQLVGDASVARLKPYIQDLVGQASQMMVQQVFQAMMSERSMLQTRQLAFENLLKKNCAWFNDDVLAMEVATVEDQAEGATAIEGPAEVGDKVRLEFQAKHLDQGEWSPVNKLAIHTLNVKSPQGQVQTGSEVLEAQLVGMAAGETREFLLPEVPGEGQEPENTRIKVTVKRVSRRPKPAPVAEASANVEG